MTRRTCLIPTLATALLCVLLQLPRNAAAADDADAVRGDPVQTADAFLKAALAGKTAEAAAMGEPGKSPSREKTIAEFAELKVKELPLASVHADGTGALAVTKGFNQPKGKGGPLVLVLIKKDGKWWIRDIDLESDESVKDELKRFLADHPEAKPVKLKDAAEEPKKDGL
jgi:hypothetical protein